MDVGGPNGDRGAEIGKRVGAPLIALCVVVAAATTAYYLLGEGRWSVADCAYMTVITLTTVGYGETLPGFSEVAHAREVTMIVIVLGMGTFLYFASSVTAIIIEGDLRRAYRYRRMTKRIKAMKNHYIVCGIGSTGRHVMQELLIADQPCVAVDLDGHRLAELAASHREGQFNFVVGDATDDDVLKEAGIERARGVVAALADDKDNLYLVVAVRSLNPRARIIARGSDLPVLDKLRRAGAHSVVSPNFIGGMRMVSELLRPHVVRFLDEMLRDTEAYMRIEEVEIPPGSPLIGTRLADTGFHSELDVGVMAVLDAEGKAYTYNPAGSFPIGERMTLVVLGPMKGINAVRARAQAGAEAANPAG